MLLNDIMKAKTWIEVLQVTHVENTPGGYKSLMRKVHPDVNRDPLAPEASAHLNSLWAQRGVKKTGTTVLHDFGGVTLLRNSDDALLVSMQYPDDSDLFQAYKQVLQNTSSLPPFYPRFVQRHQDHAAGKIAAEVRLEPGTWWLISDFEILNTRDVVWIGKRVFTSLLLAHREQMVHGNVHDGVIWVLPDQHGVTLDGWWGSVRAGENLKLRPVHAAALEGRSSRSDKRATYSFDIRAASLALLKHTSHTSGAVRTALEHLSTTDFHHHTSAPAQYALDTLNAAAKDEFGEPAFHEMTTRSDTRPDGITVKST